MSGQRRTNRSEGFPKVGVSRSDAPTDLVERYTSAHWGITPRAVYKVEDDDLPDELVEMGKLVEVQVTDENAKDPGGSGKGVSFTVKFPAGCLLAFSTDEAERLYLVTTRANRRWAANRLWVPNVKGINYSLGRAATLAGGRQADFSYPSVQVQILGVADNVVYRTNKKGDGMSEYIHALGEETGIKPFFCVSRDGRVWFAGGNYTVPDDGITD